MPATHASARYVAISRATSHNLSCPQADTISRPCASSSRNAGTPQIPQPYKPCLFCSKSACHAVSLRCPQASAQESPAASTT